MASQYKNGDSSSSDSRPPLLIFKTCHHSVSFAYLKHRSIQVFKVFAQRQNAGKFSPLHLSSSDKEISWRSAHSGRNLQVMLFLVGKKPAVFFLAAHSQHTRLKSSLNDYDSLTVAHWTHRRTNNTILKEIPRVCYSLAFSEAWGAIGSEILPVKKVKTYINVSERSGSWHAFLYWENGRECIDSIQNPTRHPGRHVTYILQSQHSNDGRVPSHLNSLTDDPQRNFWREIEDNHWFSFQ